MRLLLATTNPGKVREIRGILGGLDLDLAGLGDLPPLDEPEESGLTFAENARGKALHYAQASGMAVVAEDSGLVIDGLDGEPGVHSARYGGDGARSYPEKFALIFARLASRQALGSPARFVCELAVASGDRILFEASGTIEGVITDAPRGSGGFGYDPIFFYPPFGCTLAELDEERKATVSHRGLAFSQLRAFLQRHPLDIPDGQA